MKTKTAPVLFTSVMMNEMNKTMTFREITTPAELERVFKFRYEEYSKSRVCCLLEINQEGVDINVFDLHSRHFGLFTFNNELVGCLRVVLDRNEFYNPYVFKVGKKYRIYTDSLHSKETLANIKDADFPFLSKPNLPEGIISHYRLMKKINESFAEASRLIIREDFRGLRTSAFLIECAMMLFILFCSGQKNAVLDCCSDHRPFYERYGFIAFDDGQGYKLFDMFMDVMYLPSSSSSMPAHLKSKFEKMAVEYSQTGKISRTL